MTSNVLAYIMIFENIFEKRKISFYIYNNLKGRPDAVVTPIPHRRNSFMKTFKDLLHITHGKLPEEADLTPSKPP